MKQNIIEYFINLNERGQFYADVRRGNKTIFEIKIDPANFDNESNIFEDGFMSHPKDMAGLTDYLQSLGIIKQNEEIILGN